MKAIVVLADRSRHEIEIDGATLARGVLKFAIPRDTSYELSIGASTPLFVAEACCFRAGSDDGVPVFVER